MAYSVLHKKESAHEETIWCVAWSRNEQTLEQNIVTGSQDDTIRVWTWDEDKQLQLKHRLEGHCLGVMSVDVNREGTLLASNALDSTVKLWDLTGGSGAGEAGEGPSDDVTTVTEGRSLDSHDHDAWTVQFSPDSRVLATGSQSRQVRLYDVETLKLMGTLLTTGKFAMCIAFSPDGRLIASGAIDGPINIFETAISSKSFHTLEGHAMAVRCLAFSPDSSKLVTGSDDCQIKIYDTSKFELLHTLSGHASWVLSVTFSPDGKTFATSSADNTVKIWDLNEHECLHTFSESHEQQVWACRFSPNGSRLVSVSEDKSIVIYNTPC